MYFLKSQRDSLSPITTNGHAISRMGEWQLKYFSELQAGKTARGEYVFFNKVTDLQCFAVFPCESEQNPSQNG